MAADDDRESSPYAGVQAVPATDAASNGAAVSNTSRLDQLNQSSQIVSDSRLAQANVKGGTFTQQLTNLVGSNVEPLTDEAFDVALDALSVLFTTQNGREPDVNEYKALQKQVRDDLSQQQKNLRTRYQRLAYSDVFGSNPSAVPEQDVQLPGDQIVRYAEDALSDRKIENDHPVAILDALIFIQGAEVSEFLQGQISVTKTGTDGHNTVSFTLDNENDRFIWTERNLYEQHGASARRANADYIKQVRDEIARVQSIERQIVQDALRGVDTDNLLVDDDIEIDELLRRIKFTQQEAIKEKIFAYKTGIDPATGKARNPPIKNPKNTITFARYDLAPNRPIFNRMDPIRVFTLYPYRVPGRVYQEDTIGGVVGDVSDGGDFVSSSRRELWCPEFTGYVDNVSVSDDDITNKSTITIDCVCIRQAVLRRMRFSTDLTSGLANPLDALGFRLSPRAQRGSTAGPSVQDARLEAEFSDNTAGFYDIDSTLFYDDISNNNFNQPFPEKPLEEALREILVANEPITVERNNRGVRGITFGGNFYYDSLGFTRTQAHEFLEAWHKFCLFGPKRRPWTREEVDAVGAGTTTDGEYAPNKVRLWFLLPIEGSGPKNLADLSQVSVQMNHDANWTNRMEIIQNFVSSLDYNFMVTPCGDLVCEFSFADFRPEDFGEFKQSFRLDKGLISTQFGEEQEPPPAGLIVSIGFAAGAAAPDAIAAAQYTQVFVYSPYIAARYGVEIANESIPFLLAKDKAIAQQRAVMLYQRMLSRAHAGNVSFTYRPFLLPNRPFHHLRRSRIGTAVSVDTTMTLGQQPNAEVSVGLEHIRLFSGHYRSGQDLETLNALQQKDISSKGMDPDNINQLTGIDVTQSYDPYELQVFTTVAAGESTPTSNRVGWSDKAILAPASGIYVLDMAKVRKERRDTPQDHSVDETPAEEVGEYTPVVEEPPEEPTTYKFAANPLANMVVIGKFGGKRNHTGIDLRAKTPTACFAVDSGEIIQSGGGTNKQSAPGFPIHGPNNYGSGGNIVLLRTDSGFLVQYIHLDDETRNLGLRFGQRVAAGEQIGITGQSGGGSRTGAQPHLHMDVIVRQNAVDSGKAPKGAKKGQKIDPLPLFPGPVSDAKVS